MQDHIEFMDGHVMCLEEYDSVTVHDRYIILTKVENGVRKQVTIPWDAVKQKTRYTVLDE